MKQIRETYLTVQEFARLKDISRVHVYALINKEEIDSVKMYEKTLIINNDKAKGYQSHQGKPA